MNWYEFLTGLEYIAINNNLRLFMNRAPLGCGLHFYFRNEIGEYSNCIVFLPNRDTPEILFEKLNELAKSFS